MPPWDQTGVPIHFHSSRISGSASCMISRTFASIFPRQSPSSLIFSSMNAEADSTGTGPFMAAPTLAPNLAALSVTCNLRKWTGGRVDGWPTQARFWLEWGCLDVPNSVIPTGADHRGSGGPRSGLRLLVLDAEV